MTEKEAQKVLDELNTVRIQVLNDEAKRLFEAIMKIADNRDELQKTVEEKDKQIEQYQNMLVTNDMLHIIECENKDKIIDLMAETINDYDIDEDICEQMGQNKNCNEFEVKEKCKKCIKQYFKNKVKEA